MLNNEYLVAKIGVDTAENEPRKEWCREYIESMDGWTSLGARRYEEYLRSELTET